MTIMKGLMIPVGSFAGKLGGDNSRRVWCRTVVVSQWSLRNTARPRRSPATPAPGSAFMILARPMAVH
jgi:hypothetical protein